MKGRIAVFALLALSAAVACNAITGEHERFLAAEVDEDDAGAGGVDAGGPDVREDSSSTPPGSGPDGGDAGPTTQTVVLGTTWQSPNEAQFVVDGGTRITGFVAPKYHGMLFPATPPTQATDYKVKARILASEQHEYGVFVRGRGAGDAFSAIVLSSRLSSAATTNTPFMATINVAVDNPDVGAGSTAVPHSFTAGKVWVFEVDAHGDKVDGAIYLEEDPNGLRRTMTLTDKAPAGERGSTIGFYGYRAPNAVLLDMSVTF